MYIYIHTQREESTCQRPDCVYLIYVYMYINIYREKRKRECVWGEGEGEGGGGRESLNKTMRWITDIHGTHIHVHASTPHPPLLLLPVVCARKRSYQFVHELILEHLVEFIVAVATPCLRRSVCRCAQRHGLGTCASEIARDSAWRERRDRSQQKYRASQRLEIDRLATIRHSALTTSPRHNTERCV